jgi:hypothetical protein
LPDRARPCPADCVIYPSLMLYNIVLQGSVGLSAQINLILMMISGALMMQ